MPAAPAVSRPVLVPPSELVLSATEAVSRDRRDSQGGEIRLHRIFGLPIHSFRLYPQPTAAAAGPNKDLTLKAMQKFAEKYCEITDTYFCSDLEIAATVVKGKL